MIAVCGATGRIGTQVVASALGDGVDVRAVGEPGIANPWSDTTAEWASAAFEAPDQLRRAFDGADAVLLVTPPDPRQVWWQRNIIDAAAACGVTWIVKVSAFASRPDSPTNMGRWHYDGELALRDSTIAHAVVRPQYFMDNLLRSAREIRERGELRAVLTPAQRIAMIDVRDVAAVCYRLLADGHSRDRVLVPTGPEAVTMGQVAARLSAVSGYPITYHPIPHDEARRADAQASRPRWHTEDLLAIAEDCGPQTTSCVFDVTGAHPRSLEDFAHGHASTLQR